MWLFMIWYCFETCNAWDIGWWLLQYLVYVCWRRIDHKQYNISLWQLKYVYSFLFSNSNNRKPDEKKKRVFHMYSFVTRSLAQQYFNFFLNAFLFIGCVALFTHTVPRYLMNFHLKVNCFSFWYLKNAIKMHENR